MPAKKPRRFRALPGTHSETLNEHLFARWINRPKGEKPERMHARLRRKAQIVALRMFKFQPELIRKLKRADTQKLMIDEARRKLQSGGEVQLMLNRRLNSRALEEVNEIIDIEVGKKHPDGDVLQSAGVLELLFRYSLQTLPKIDAPAFNNKYLQLIENVHATYLQYLLGTKTRKYHQMLEEAYAYIDQLIQRSGKYGV